MKKIKEPNKIYEEEPPQVTGKIPDDFIPKADNYMLGSAKTKGAKLINLGGKIMLEHVVMNQMLAENIISIHGVGKIKCILVVDYTDDEIRKFIFLARQRAKEAAVKKN